MYAKFKELDVWPSRQQCNEYMPEHVRNLQMKFTFVSGILEKDWEKKDVLMADHGFNIQDLFEQKRVRVNIPPFLNGKPQLSEEELVKTRRIATIRIHVERAIETLRTIIFWITIIPASMCQNKFTDQVFLFVQCYKLSTSSHLVMDHFIQYPPIMG